MEPVRFNLITTDPLQLSDSVKSIRADVLLPGLLFSRALPSARLSRFTRMGSTDSAPSGRPKPFQIQLELQERELIITGEIRDGNGDGRRHRSSRRTGRFEYRTYLPSDIRPDMGKAKLHDGILTVTVPKSEAAKPRQIQIVEE